MNIQHTIMIFMDSIYHPVADSVAQVISLFGFETIQIGILLFIYWCLDKKKGFTACLTLTVVNAAANIVKAIVRAPRPWHVLEEIQFQRDVNATGYSFPSGHTAASAAFYGSMANLYRKRWLSIICAVVISLVAFSRIYLCVHWPLDVAGGLLLGCAGFMYLNGPIMKLYDDREKSFKLFLTGGIITSVAAMVLSLILLSGRAEEILLSDLSKGLALLGGLLLGYLAEINTSDFKIEEGCAGRKAARLIIGFAGVMLILPLGKSLLNRAGLYNAFTAQLRYFLVALWSAALWPMLGKKLKLFV